MPIQSQRDSLLEITRKPTENYGQRFFRLPNAIAIGERETRVLPDYLNNAFSNQAKAYANAWKRRRAAFQSLGDCCLLLQFSLRTPLIAAAGEAGADDFGLMLHPLWGVPVLRGSGLKGCISSFAHQRGGESWARQHVSEPRPASDGASAAELFGGIHPQLGHLSGCVAFHDAWWVPKPTKNEDYRTASPFQNGEDILTPHYSSYLAGKEPHPHGMESPVPVPFVHIPAGGSFELAVVLPDAAWDEVVRSLIINALRENGFGGKTRLGYGRMKFLREEEIWPSPKTAKQPAPTVLGPVRATPAATTLTEFVRVHITGQTASGFWKCSKEGGTVLEIGMVSQGDTPENVALRSVWNLRVISKTPKQWVFTWEGATEAT